MKNRLLMLTLTAALLCGCGSAENSSGAENIPAAGAVGAVTQTVTTASDSSTAETSISVPVKTEPTTLRPRAYEDSITAGHTVSDYTVTLKCTVRDCDINTDYEGEITDGEQLARVWDMLKAAEAAPPNSFAGYFGNGGQFSSVLTLTPKWGGQEVSISGGIGYYNEGEEGGPSIFVFEGYSAPDGGIYTMCCTEEYGPSWLEELCRDTVIKQDKVTGQSIEDKQTIDSEVIFVSRSTNWAWGVYDSLTFVDMKGCIYSLTLSSGNDNYDYIPKTVEQLLPELDRMIKDGNTLPVGRLDDDDAAALPAIRALGADIPADARPTEDEEISRDAGQKTLYLVADRVIELNTRGDVEHELDDPAARKAAEMYSEMMYTERE
ncbi:MAG: hypothetical protein IJR91_02925 [Ruminococcus sp.]|nr:hypothetical protein [Ruminococcus sp.]